MTKLKQCPDCLAVEAFKRKIEQSGRKWIPSKTPCDRCGGSGRVKDDYRDKPGKRRKDMSGAEWYEADREDEWKQYVNDRPID